MERGGEDGERGSNERGGQDRGCHGHTISTCCTWGKCDRKMEGGKRGDGCVHHRSCLPAPTRRVCAHTFQPPQSKVEGSKTPWWLLKSEFPFPPSVSPRLPVDAATITTLFGLEEEAWSQRAEDKVRIEQNFTCPPLLLVVGSLFSYGQGVKLSRSQQRQEGNRMTVCPRP